ncbi:uncharacterized protein LOC143289685 [Babylonia areolata]|uniref:uncharacterized protein LOC143289685 n=1 Tax=Babylonia areolata TaxID=304850 RepID=UPI003FD65376
MSGNVSKYNSPEQTTVQSTILTESCIEVRLLNVTGDAGKEVSDDGIGPEVETYAQKFQLTVLLVLFVIGFPANVINMAVFCKQGLGDRVNLCLFSLSLTDWLFLTSSMCLNAENIYLYLSTGTPKRHWNAFMVNHNFICFLGTGFISFVLSAIIACERCYCVLIPLKYQTLLRTRTMAFIIVSVYAVLFSLHFIVAMKYRVGCVYDPVTDTLVTMLTEGEFYKSHRELVDRLDGIVFGIGVSGCMMAVVITATITTTIKLRQLMTWRTETSSSQLSSREVALTKMLIGNSVFFIVCASPACLFRVVWFFLPEFSAGGRHHSLYLSTLWVLEGFCYINYTFNFFVYYVMGSRYRDTFWTLFGRHSDQKKTEK